MCLSSVGREFVTSKTMQFYKVMLRLRRKGNCNLYKFKVMNHCKPLTKGVTRLGSVGSIDLPNDGFDSCPPSYRAGFHGYLSLKQAASFLRYAKYDVQRYHRYHGRHRGYPVVVLCEGLVHTTGNQRGKKVVVAKTMKILKEIPLTQLFPGKVRIR